MGKSGAYIKPLALGYLTFLLPVLTFHLSWAVSMAQGVFEPCFPYWADCVSISHTGRHELAYFIFKGGIIPTAVLLILFWNLCRTWLASLGCKNLQSIFVLAIMGSVALIIYTLALGHSGDQFRLARRFGVVLFMFCTFITQVLIGRALSEHPEKWLRNAGKRLLYFSSLILGIAIFSLVLDASLGRNYDRMEDAFEWWLIMMLLVHLLLVARLWGRTDFGLIAVTNNSCADAQYERKTKS